MFRHTIWEAWGAGKRERGGGEEWKRREVERNGGGTENEEEKNSFKKKQYHTSNGVVSLSLVKDILQARPNSVILFIPAEIVTSAMYVGHDRARMITNALFRAGGAAALFTNRRDLKSRAKYRLLQQERVHTGASDVAFKAMYYGPDEKGLTGIALTKDIPPEAAKAIEKVLRIITPKMLTPSQLLDFSKHFLRKKFGGNKKSVNAAEAEAEEAAAAKAAAAASAAPAKKDPYAPPPRAKDEWLPDYTQCIDHFILHAGGYGVLKGIQKGMRLPSETLLPSFATLRDIGNTSSSSTWYTFAYLESVSSGVKKGERLLQLGVGGGMKASAAVWQAMRDVEDTHRAWAHLGRRAVEQSDLPRLIDEGDPESCAAHEAKVCAEAEALRAARKVAAEEEAEAGEEEARARALLSPRADSAGEHELERAMPAADVKGGLGAAAAAAAAAAAEAEGATAVEA